MAKLVSFLHTSKYFPYFFCVIFFLKFTSFRCIVLNISTLNANKKLNKRKSFL